MTKPTVGPSAAQGHRIANFDLSVCHHHTVDQQLHQRSLFLEGRLVQSRLDVTTKFVARCCNMRQFMVLFGHCLQLSPLCLQAFTACRELGSLPLKFGERNHLGEIGVQQPSLLPFQADDPLMHSGTSGLQFLR